MGENYRCDFIVVKNIPTIPIGTCHFISFARNKIRWILAHLCCSKIEPVLVNLFFICFNLSLIFQMAILKKWDVSELHKRHSELILCCIFYKLKYNLLNIWNFFLKFNPKYFPSRNFEVKKDDTIKATFTLMNRKAPGHKAVRQKTFQIIFLFQLFYISY